MIVARKIIVDINKLAQLVRTFDMKDLEQWKQILGMEIHEDMKDSNIWLSQNKYVEKY
jgi:hypothetical protein